MTPLTWSKENPCVAGWYWWRHKGTEMVMKIRQDHLDRSNLIRFGTKVYFLEEVPGQWAGPLASPEEE